MQDHPYSPALVFASRILQSIEKDMFKCLRYITLEKLLCYVFRFSQCAVEPQLAILSMVSKHNIIFISRYLPID